MTEPTPERSPDDPMDVDKEARMLLNPPGESVQFLQNANATNGQVVLPINNRQSSGVGMSKQELMKYANDPFWIRLRMTLFVLFWVVWFAMLIGAVLIIAFAPGCPATSSLPWWKKCSLIQVDINLDDQPTIKEKLTRATNKVNDLKENIGVLQDSKMDGYLLTGLDPFLLQTDNDTQVESDKFKNALVELISEVHGDDVKGKIIVGLQLGETSTSHQWFTESSVVNATQYRDYYIWKKDKPINTTLRWDYRSELLLFWARITEGKALLNYANTPMRDEVHQLFLNWVRTKLDGIQLEGDLYVNDEQGQVHPSSDTLLQVHKWVKSGGQNKALLVADSKLREDLTVQGEDDATYELSPESTLWTEISTAGNVQEALKKAFSHYVQLEKETVEQNVTKDGSETKEDVGQGWRTFVVDYPASEQNPITSKHGVPIAEGVLAAFFFLPKSTPIVKGLDPVQVAKLKNDKFISKLNDLRDTHSESFLLGRTEILQVTSDHVFAVSRIYKEKNMFILLINFATTSQEFEVKGTFPDATLFTPRIALTDTSNSNSTPLEKVVNMKAIKLEPHQVLFVEFAPNE